MFVCVCVCEGQRERERERERKREKDLEKGVEWLAHLFYFLGPLFWCCEGVSNKFRLFLRIDVVVVVVVVAVVVDQLSNDFIHLVQVLVVGIHSLKQRSPRMGAWQGLSGDANTALYLQQSQAVSLFFKVRKWWFWVVEVFFVPDFVPLSQYLTKDSASTAIVPSSPQIIIQSARGITEQFWKSRQGWRKQESNPGPLGATS